MATLEDITVEQKGENHIIGFHFDNDNQFYMSVKKGQKHTPALTEIHSFIPIMISRMNDIEAKAKDKQ